MPAADYVSRLGGRSLSLDGSGSIRSDGPARGYFSPEVLADITGDKKGFGEPAPLPFS